MFGLAIKVMVNVIKVMVKVMVNVMVMVMVFKTFEGALRLAAGAFFSEKRRFLEKMIFLKLRKIDFYEKMSFFVQKHYF